MTQRDKHTTQKKTGHRLWRTVYLFSLPIYLLNEKSGQCMKGSVKKTKKTQHEGQRYQNKKKNRTRTLEDSISALRRSGRKIQPRGLLMRTQQNRFFSFFFLKSFSPFFQQHLGRVLLMRAWQKGFFFVFFCLFFCSILP